VALEVGVGLCAGAVAAKARKSKGKREEAGKPEEKLLNINLHDSELAA
jgi:ribonucleotide monophosphatase NagD (HAD superfamily)